jgi:ABC-type Fe3+ transport system permease subunit
MGRNVWLMLSAGAMLLIVAVAGFVIVPPHAPTYSDVPEPFGSNYPTPWSTAAYDAARIATWAALIVGLILVLVGLIAAWRSPRYVPSA